MSDPSNEVRTRFQTVIRLAERYASPGPFDALGTLALCGLIEHEVEAIRSVCHHALRAP
jgi:hypothetical protein